MIVTMDCSKLKRGTKIWYYPSGSAGRNVPRKRPALFVAVSSKRVEIMLLTPEGPGVHKYVLEENIELRFEDHEDDIN